MSKEADETNNYSVSDKDIENLYDEWVKTKPEFQSGSYYAINFTKWFLQTIKTTKP